MDQSDIAKLLNVSVAYINQVEEGNIKVSEEINKEQWVQYESILIEPVQKAHKFDKKQKRT